MTTLKDPPILLIKDRIDGPLYEPISVFVGYVDALLQAGLTLSDLPQVFVDLFLLEYYHTQVMNGGHSQFIGNSGDQLKPNLTRAAAGARMLGLTQMAGVIDDCHAWVQGHPALAAQQTGATDGRAPALDLLDKRLFAIELDDAAYAEFVASQSPDIQDWILRGTAQSQIGARDPYHLSVGAWLLSQTNTRVLPFDNWQAEIRRIVAADDMAQARAMAQRFDRIQGSLPSLDETAVALLLAKVLPPEQRYGHMRRIDHQTGKTEYWGTLVAEGGHEEDEKKVLMRKGNRFSLHARAARPPFTWGFALKQLGVKLGLVSRSDMFRAMMNRPPCQPARELASVTLDGDPAAELARLHIPTALALFHGDDARAWGSFASGKCRVFDTQSPHIIWDYPNRTATCRLELTSEGVRLGTLGTEDVQFFSTQTLRDEAARHISARDTVAAS